MKSIYQVTIHGRTLEGRDLKQLLARAVSEKRNMDRSMRYYPGARATSYCLLHNVSANR